MRYNSIINWILEFLNTNPHFHLRTEEISSIDDLVFLIDRFIDGNLKYDLEWDDFISWENNNPSIEIFRNKIADLERLFFSKNKLDREQAIRSLIDERNRAAAYCNLPIRSID